MNNVRTATILPLLLLSLLRPCANASDQKVLGDLRRLLSEAATDGQPIPDDRNLMQELEQSDGTTQVDAADIYFTASKSDNVLIRRRAMIGYFEVSLTGRPSKFLDSSASAIVTLLTDPDLPIRRMSAITIQDLSPHADSPYVLALIDYLGRQDAVAANGGGMAGLLLQLAPQRPDALEAVTRYMSRNDHTAVSRQDVIQSIRVAGTKDIRVGRALSFYLDDPDERVARSALDAMGGMGPDVVRDNQPNLARMANDPRRSPETRRSAAKMAASIQ